jgi:hypothetical protein
MMLLMGIGARTIMSSTLIVLAPAITLSLLNPTSVISARDSVMFSLYYIGDGA